MGNIVVYTAITPGYDSLKSAPELWRSQAEFVAFLDKPQPSFGWTVRPIYRRFQDPCRNAKIHKILPEKYFPEAQYSLWVDGSVKIISNTPIAKFADEFLREHDIAVFKHRHRTCLYQEAARCLKLGLDSASVINGQTAKYYAEGYPQNNGLAECTVILRRHSRQVMKFNEAWYAEIKRWSRRDQLSFNYVAQKLGLKYKLLTGLLDNNRHFFWLPHVHSQA